MSVLPLDGVGILVTRPAGQAEELESRLDALGGNVILFPGLDIEPPSDPAALAHVIGKLRDYDLIIFISPTAVESFWPFIHERFGDWPRGFSLAAVGRGTARALSSYQAHHVLVPEDGADSESLLALERLQQVAGQHILIVRGEGGREMLADTLRQRGATVDYAQAYRRVKPAVDPRALLAVWRQGGVRAVTVTSREILANLFDLLGDEGAALLISTPMFVIHERIAAVARERGVVKVIITAPGDDGLVSGLLDWFNPEHD